MKTINPFWVYVGLVSVLVIVLAYYQGFVQDVNAAGPFLIKAGELAQGRNPATGDFSAYPKNPNP